MLDGRDGAAGRPRNRSPRPQGEAAGGRRLAIGHRRRPRTADELAYAALRKVQEEAPTISTRLSGASNGSSTRTKRVRNTPLSVFTARSTPVMTGCRVASTPLRDSLTNCPNTRTVCQRVPEKIGRAHV